MNSSAKLAKAGRTLIICVPLPPRRRGGRKFIVGPGGITWTGRRVVVDNTIVKALGRAHRGKAMLESGEYGSMTELARAEKINLSYLCRVLRLTLLAPDIASALLGGKHSCLLQLSDLLRPISLIWAEQRSEFERALGNQAGPQGPRPTKKVRALTERSRTPLVYPGKRGAAMH
jgi:hypothetical protein